MTTVRILDVGPRDPHHYETMVLGRIVEGEVLRHEDSQLEPAGWDLVVLRDRQGTTWRFEQALAGVILENAS